VALVRLLSAVGVGALVSVAGCADDGEASRPSSTATSVAPVRVGRITTTIAPEAMQLGEGVGIDLRVEVREILERVDGLLQFDTDVAVEVVVDPARVIPDVGVGAARVNAFEAGFFGNHCVVVVSSWGSLIHTVVGRAGGWGGLRTNRSGWAA
jgi:hypothetical protein